MRVRAILLSRCAFVVLLRNRVFDTHGDVLEMSDTFVDQLFARLMKVSSSFFHGCVGTLLLRFS